MDSCQPLVDMMQLDVGCYRNSLLLPCGVSWRFCAPALRFLLPLSTDLYTSASSLFGCDPQQDQPLLPSLKYLQRKPCFTVCFDWTCLSVSWCFCLTIIITHHSFLLELLKSHGQSRSFRWDWSVL